MKDLIYKLIQKEKIHNLYKIILLSLKKFIKTNSLNHAASLSFYTILSLLPVVFIALSIFFSFDSFSQTRDNAIEYIGKTILFPDAVYSSPEYKGLIEDFVNETVKGTTAISLVSILFLLFSATEVLILLEHTFNSIWQIKESRSYLQNFVLFIVVFTLGPIFLGLTSYVYSTLSEALPFMGKFVTDYIFPVLILGIFFYLILQLIPHVKVSFKAAFIGAIVTSSLFWIARILFSFYVSNFATQSLGKIFGPLSIIPIFIFWIFVSYGIIIYGGIISYIMQSYPDIIEFEKKYTNFNNFYLYYIITSLLYIYKRYNEGSKGVELKEISRYTKLSLSEQLEIAKILEKSEIIKKIDFNRNKYIPLQPAELINVKSVLDVAYNTNQEIPPEQQNVHPEIK